MRIAQVCPRYNPCIGGVETHVTEISERLVKKGFDVEVLTTDPSGELPGEEIINSVKVRRFKIIRQMKGYYFSRELKKYLMKNSDDFDVVHAHSYHAFPALYAAQAKGMSKLVFSPWYHGTGHSFLRKLLHIPYRLVGRKIFEKADRIVCASNYEKNLIAKHFRINKGKIKLIMSGVDLDKFKLRKRKKDHRTILYVGRLEKYKGVQYIIMALPKLSRDIILEVVGKGTYTNLIPLARKLNVEDRVRFCGSLPNYSLELLQKYIEADLFILLSKHESFGISVAEALAAKTPCIVANTSALKEWVDNKNCFGIDYSININKLTKLINEVIGREIGGVKLYDWDDTVRELNRIYKEIC